MKALNRKVFKVAYCRQHEGTRVITIQFEGVTDEIGETHAQEGILQSKITNPKSKMVLAPPKGALNFQVMYIAVVISVRTKLRAREVRSQFCLS